jgi:hypothetical protein
VDDLEELVRFIFNTHELLVGKWLGGVP